MRAYDKRILEKAKADNLRAFQRKQKPSHRVEIQLTDKSKRKAFPVKFVKEEWKEDEFVLFILDRNFKKVPDFGQFTKKDIKKVRDLGVSTPSI